MTQCNTENSIDRWSNGAKRQRDELRKPRKERMLPAVLRMRIYRKSCVELCFRTIVNVPATILLFSITCFASIWFSCRMCSRCRFSSTTFLFRVSDFSTLDSSSKIVRYRGVRVSKGHAAALEIVKNGMLRTTSLRSGHGRFWEHLPDRFRLL